MPETDIQTRAVPLALSGRDLIGLGETGSGKTAAYGLPILERLLRSPRGLRALILVPTRELCVQGVVEAAGVRELLARYGDRRHAPAPRARWATP